MTSQPCTGQSTSYGVVKSADGVAGGWGRSGCTKGAPRSANKQGEEQHRHTERVSTADKEEGHSKAGEATRTAGTGNQNRGDGRACAWEAATTKGMAWPASPVATGCQGNPCSTGISWGCLPQPRWAVCATGAGAHQGQTSREGEKDIWWTARTTRGGTWASRIQNYSKAGYERPVDRGAWTTKTVKRPRQQPAHTQYANYWAPLTRKRHTMPHSAQPQHTKYWAPRTRKRHQQEQKAATRRNMRREGPRKGTTTRWSVTQGGYFIAGGDLPSQAGA